MPMLPGVVDWEAEDVAHELVERVVSSVVAVDAHHPHAVIHHLHSCLTAEDLGHRADRVAFDVVEIGVVRRLPAQIPRRLESHRAIDQRVANDLMVDDRIGATRCIGLGDQLRTYS